MGNEEYTPRVQITTTLSSDTTPEAERVLINLARRMPPWRIRITRYARAGDLSLLLVLGHLCPWGHLCPRGQRPRGRPRASAATKGGPRSEAEWGEAIPSHRQVQIGSSLRSY